MTLRPSPFPVLLLASVLAFAPLAIAQTGKRFLIAETVDPAPKAMCFEVAAATGQFSRFLEAVEAAGYAQTLGGEGPFTLFAPTDEAFAHINLHEADRLLAPPATAKNCWRCSPITSCPNA